MSLSQNDILAQHILLVLSVAYSLAADVIRRQTYSLFSWFFSLCSLVTLVP